MTPDDLPVRLARRIEPEPMSGCWLWTGFVRPDGYGSVWDTRVGKKKGAYAHRLVYELLVGPIPEVLELDHLCRNRACVSPWHLEPVTASQNRQRGVATASLRARAAAITHCPQGHPYSGDNLYVSPRGRRYCRICGRAHRRERERLDRSVAP